MDEVIRKKIKYTQLSQCSSKIVAVSGDNSILVYCAKTGALMHKTSVHRDTVQAVLFSQCGKKIISGSSDKSVRVFTAIRF